MGLLSSTAYDAVVVGAGPNGLAAAVRLAQAGLSVIILEANDTIGGGVRSQELTLPGFVHDLCSAVHPFGIASPFFRSLGLERYGLEWVMPELPLAHPLEGDAAGILESSISATAARLGHDGPNYKRLFSPLVANSVELTHEVLQPLLHIPKRPLLLARFAAVAFRSAQSLSAKYFRTEPARALLAGLAAHSFLPLEKVPSAAFGLILGMLGHTAGWPFARGGSQQIAKALSGLFCDLGGTISTGRRVGCIHDLPSACVVLWDTAPRQFLDIAQALVPGAYRRCLERFRHGPGIFKADYALSEPIPWRTESCRRAGTVHVGGTFEEIAFAERQAVQGTLPERPFVLVAQPTVFDPTRAPHGKHVAWAYCHVPSGSTVDMSEAIEKQIERFAPGFRDVVMARHTRNCAQLEAGNSNLIGGSIDGGVTDFWQLLARPTLTAVPYRIPIKGWYLCSASTPPGAGVHGMCGFNAAEAALRDWFGEFARF